LLTPSLTVSLVSHYLWLTRPFSLTALASWHRIEEEAVLVDLVVTLTRREGSCCQRNMEQ
jgi:hypothetical protein